MEKRLLIALALAAIVIVVSQKLFPAPPVPVKLAADSTTLVTVKDSTPAALGARGLDSIAARSGVTTSTPSVTSKMEIAEASSDTLSVTTPKATYYFTPLGAAPLDVVLNDYRVMPKASNKNVRLGRPHVPLLSYAVLKGRDTLELDKVKFDVDTTGRSATPGIAFTAVVEGARVSIAYAFNGEGYLANVHGSVKGVDSTSMLLIRMHKGLPFVEADSSDDLRSLAYVAKPLHEDAHSIAFAKLDSLAPSVERDSLAWVASKNKYFLLAIIATPPGKPFGAAVFTRGPHEPKAVSSADALILQPLTQSGEFAFDMYSGPQEWRRLHQMGRNLEHVNPYGSFLRPIVQPFATIVMQVVLWIHDRLKINYGWVLIIFGITIRLLLWPLNQGAMRNSLKLQRIQPQLQEIQKKYKSNPEKLQSEMSKLYRDHGMSPFTPLAGCLPMLIPMPVLFALYFVFQNTIEFRGVSFLWLPDLSQRDPLFVLPAVMGISMYVLSWISLRSAPPNPQAKTMAYVFPVMMVVFFWRLAAGLNLYYAVQNLATLPQQWLIARERAKLADTPASG
ncbi:MAG: membrane protein insertase YidC [Gemmatimonadota bacterium]|nr:membrane protein insertase YidC [Gemmatimonadota bacterium]